MVVKIFGVLDILAALSILLLHFVDWWKIPLLVSLYLITKGAVFYMDVFSYVDMFCAVWTWVMLLIGASWFDYAIFAYLLQKGIYSLS